MSFLEEYKKMLACLVLLIFLVVLQYVTGQDMTGWIKQVLDVCMILLGAGAIKFSVLKTSERQLIKSKLPPKDSQES